MSFTKSIIAGAIVLMILPMAADAQRRGGNFRIGGTNSAEQLKIQLLQMEAVRKELKLDEEAGKKIADMAADVRDELRQEMRSMFQDARDMDAEERQELGKKLQKMMSEINGDAWKEMSKLVSKDQMKRLDQLVLQRRGVNALLGKDIQKELGITEDQVKKMQETNKELREEFMEELQALREERDIEGMQEAQKEYRDSTKAAFMKVLTDKQKKKLKEMMGEEFKFPQRQRRGRGRN